jgi:hypothetical protein
MLLPSNSGVNPEGRVAMDAGAAHPATPSMASPTAAVCQHTTRRRFMSLLRFSLLLHHPDRRNDHVFSENGVKSVLRS